MPLHSLQITNISSLFESFSLPHPVPRHFSHSFSSSSSLKISPFQSSCPASATSCTACIRSCRRFHLWPVDSETERSRFGPRIPGREAPLRRRDHLAWAYPRSPRVCRRPPLNSFPGLSVPFPGETVACDSRSQPFVSHWVSDSSSPWQPPNEIPPGHGLRFRVRIRSRVNS